MEHNDQPWKVIYCASRQEKKVSSYLEKQNIVHYLPVVKVLKQWSDRRKWVEVPLFNAYIFVKPEITQRDAVLQIPGVVKYIWYNGSDAQVSHKDIAFLRHLIDKGYQVQQNELGAELNSGDLVMVIDGPFIDQEVEVHYNDNDTFVVVWVEGLSVSYKVNLPREFLKLKKKNKDRNKALW